MGQKFRKNLSISHGFGDTSIFVFWEKVKKIQNGRHFWKDKKCLETGSPNQHGHPARQKFR